MSEIEFIYGLADAIGAEASEADKERTAWYAMRLRAKACIKVLDKVHT